MLVIRGDVPRRGAVNAALTAIPDISDLPVGDGVANLSVRQGAICPCPAAADRDGGLKGTAAAVPQLLHPDHPAVLPRAGQRLNGGLHRLRRHRDHCQGVTAGGIGIILCLSGGAPLLRQRDMGGAAQTVAEHQDQNHHHQDNKARGDPVQLPFLHLRPPLSGCRPRQVRRRILPADPAAGRTSTRWHRQSGGRHGRHRKDSPRGPWRRRRSCPGSAAPPW